MSHAPYDPPISPLPPGQRWGKGADSVVPYLSISLQARAARADEVPDSEQFIRNPVFLHMDHTLRALRQSH